MQLFITNEMRRKCTVRDFLGLEIQKKQIMKKKFMDRPWRKAKPSDDKRSGRVNLQVESCSTSNMDLEAETALSFQLGDEMPRRSQEMLEQVTQHTATKPVKKASAGFLRTNGAMSRKRRGNSWYRSSFHYLRANVNDVSESFPSSVSSANGNCHALARDELVQPHFFPSGSACVSRSRVRESDDPSEMKGRKLLRNGGIKESEQGGKACIAKPESKKQVSKGHLSLSEKYVPRSFDEIVGQQIVTMSLTNIIVKQKIVSLYLFYGPRGTGKSATARIFAAALNCSFENGYGKPCWECKNCSNFRSGRSSHVREIHAENIEEAAGLKQHYLFNLQCPEYNILIADDCHELNAEALNLLLLECLENPLANIVIILTTPDSEVLPKTLLSRCQKFRFQKLKDFDIFNKLKRIASFENIEIEDEALHMIASRAEGSLALAEDSLDQVSLLSVKVTVSTVRRMIGVIPSQKLSELLFFALAADTEKTVKTAREIMDCGVTPLALVSQLASLITDVLAGDCSFTEAKQIQKFLSRHEASREMIVNKLGQALRILVEAEKQLRVSNTCGSCVTAALLKLGQDCFSDSNCDSGRGTQVSMDSVLKDCNEADQGYTGELRRSYRPSNSAKDMTKDAEVSSSLQINLPFERTSGRNVLVGSDSMQEGQEFVAIHGPDRSEACPSESNHLSSCRIEEIWQHVLRSSHSTTLDDLLQGQGRLVSLLVQRGKAIAHVEFRDGKQGSSKIEALEQRISHALQEVLRCPVDVKMTMVHAEQRNGSSEEEDKITCCGCISSCCARPFKCIWSCFRKILITSKQVLRLPSKCLKCQPRKCYECKCSLPKMACLDCRNCCTCC